MCAPAGASARRDSGRSRDRPAAPSRGPAGGPAAGRGRARSCGSTSDVSSARRGRTAARPARRPPRPPRPATPRGARTTADSRRAPGARGRAGWRRSRRCGASRRRSVAAGPWPDAVRSDDGWPVAGSRAGSGLVACRHDAAVVATLAGAPASLRSLRFSGFSVPTSVSLSSPRMNASTRLYAMSSWICWGGLFMK